MKNVLSISQPGIRVTKQYVGGKVEGWNRFMWDKAFFIFYFKTFIPKLQYPCLHSLCWHRKKTKTKEQKQKLELRITSVKIVL